jgi:catechol 2,3-dioxygenase-like lactoylglutathione lyase family enzyme
MNLEHIALNVPDARAAADWYEEHLGMEIVKRSEDPPYIHFLRDDDGSMIELYSNPAGAVPEYGEMSPFTLHLAFAVEDMAAEHERLLTAGATSIGPIETTPAGDLLAFLRDPWGVTVQLVRRKNSFGKD